MRREIITTEVPDHKQEVETWLKAHAYRRRKDYQYFMGPKANVWQFLSRMEALYRCLIMLERERGLDLTKAKILDVGSSNGGEGLAKLMALSFSSKQLYGIDILEDRIGRGREMYPGLNLYNGDATNMSFFSDQQFDIVMEGFCFCHIARDNVREKVAREMIRVTKVGGYILVFDWVVGRRQMNINGLPLKKIKSMFDVGSRTTLVKRYPGQLLPPIGRPISTLVPALYPVVQCLFPFTVGSKLTVLTRVA